MPGTRRYELKARADGQRETREAIARAASELHEERGVVGTTVTEIARRAGVSRLTVYNHFPDLEHLLPACAAHYASLHPAPDFARALTAENPRARVCTALSLLYGWYRETSSLFTKVLSERILLPELDRFLVDDFDRLPTELTGLLASTLQEPDEGCRVLLRLATDFWTWHRLDQEGLGDEAAAELMCRACWPTEPRR